jgi:chemotaxis protein methyltransferase WspC
MSLERVQGQLTERRGIDPASLSRVGLQAAIRRRMAALSIASEGHYADRLVVDAVEFERLVAAVLVHETSFFRYPSSFELLAREAVTRLRESPRATFRIACVATSTGEEPASAVMALLEAGLVPGQFHVDASDVSARAIEYANAGR